MTLHRKLFRHSPALPLLVLGLALASYSPALAQREANLKSSPKIKAAFRDILAKPSLSVVRVQCDDKDVALGTVVGADGWIITKASLLKSDKITCRLHDGKTVTAELAGVQDAHDLAMLKVNAKSLTPIEWKTSKDAVVGNWVASAGPDKDPVAIGVVSVAAREIPMKSYPPSFRPNSGFLGVTMAPDPVEGGVKVTSVKEGSAAAKAGIKDGDIILALNNKPVADMDELRGMLQKHKAGDTVTLKFRREKAEQEAKATLGSPPADLSRGDVQNNMGSVLSEKRTGFPNILQHDTVIEPKDCGGPLVDLDGKAVGINVARAGRVESYAVPSDTVLTVLADLKSGKLKPSVLDALIAEIKKHEESIKTNEAYRDGLKKLVAQAEELKAKYGKDDKELIDVHARTVEKLKSTETLLAKVKAELEKTKAELKKAQEKEPKKS